MTFKRIVALIIGCLSSFGIGHCFLRGIEAQARAEQEADLAAQDARFARVHRMNSFADPWVRFQFLAGDVEPQAWVVDSRPDEGERRPAIDAWTAATRNALETALRDRDPRAADYVYVRYAGFCRFDSLREQLPESPDAHAEIMESLRLLWPNLAQWSVDERAVLVRVATRCHIRTQPADPTHLADCLRTGARSLDVHNETATACIVNADRSTAGYVERLLDRATL